MKLDRIEILSVAGTAFFVALSGYLYTSVEYSYVVQNERIRAAATLALVAVLAARLFFYRRLVLPKIVWFIFIPIAYMGLVGVVRSDGFESGGAIARWLLYLLTFVFFSQENGYRHIRTFVGGLFICYAFSAGVDLAFGRALHINQAVRIVGSIGSPVGFGASLLCVAFFAMWFYLLERRTIYLVASILSLLLIFTTGTRSLAIGGVALVGMLWWLGARSKAVKISSVALAAWLVPTIGAWIIYNTDVGHRLLLIGDSGADSSWTNRDFIIRSTIDNIASIDAVVGVGLGRFPVWFEEITGVANMAPHLEIIWLGVEGGIIGGVLSLCSLVIVSMYFVRALRKKSIGGATALVSLFCLWSQQSVFQLANPTFFYQCMMAMYGVLGAIAGEMTRAKSKRMDVMEASGHAA